MHTPISEKAGTQTIVDNLSWLKNDMVIVGSNNTFDNKINCRMYKDVESFIGSPDVSTNLVVFFCSPHEQDNQLKLIRSEPKTSMAQVFVTDESPLAKFLSNGHVSELNEALRRTYLAKLEQIKVDYSVDVKNRLLAYKWLHEKTLEPKVDPTTAGFFSYPLLEALAGGVQQSDSIINNLLQSNLISKGLLINRIRQCSKCSSSHLNYVDVCPKCHSLETESYVSIHCFKCGYVGKQERFKRAGGLSCPNCVSVLRHIGVDYDRPIETLSCGSCEHVFNEPEVVAECLQCLHVNSTDALTPANIYSFKLTSTAKDLVRTGREAFTFIPQLGEQLSDSHLFWLADWFNKLAIRYDQKHILLSLKATNLPEFIRVQGEIEAGKRLDEIQEHLINLLRVTDPCTNYSDSGLLMLLPMTTSTQLLFIIEKLKALYDKQAGERLEFELKFIELPIKHSGHFATWVLDALNGQTPEIL